MPEWRNVLVLAFRDYSHEWRMSGCFVFGLAAVLAPLMVLFGVKFGIITSMLTALAEDPHNRELRPLGSGHYTQEWLAEMSNRPEVAFVVARTRTLAATIDLKSGAATHIVPAELIPSGAQDPLLASTPAKPEGLDRVVLSETAARRLNVAAGASIDASLSRQYGGQHERVHLQLEVAAVVPARGFDRAAVFSSLGLVVAAEAFRDGRSVPELGWLGDPPQGAERSYPSYRLYARSIYDVAPLAQRLMKAGHKLKTKAAEIETVASINRNLTLVFWTIASAGLVGFSLSLGASLWANTDRKRRELSVLRLVGVGSEGIVLFPAFQALFTALLGWLSAVLMYLLLERIINRMLGSHLETGQVVCYLLPVHFLGALGLTLISALCAALVGGARASRVEPSEGLREI